MFRDEWGRTLDMGKEQLFFSIKELMNTKQAEIEQLKAKISAYEQKRRAEARFYQSLSTVRKWFASRPPSHHQAVEYMVYVKERMKQIDRLRVDIDQLQQVIEDLEKLEDGKQLIVSTRLIDEMETFLKRGE